MVISNHNQSSSVTLDAHNALVPALIYVILAIMDLT